MKSPPDGGLSESGCGHWNKGITLRYQKIGRIHTPENKSTAVLIHSGAKSSPNTDMISAIVPKYSNILSSLESSDFFAGGGGVCVRVSTKIKSSLIRVAFLWSSCTVQPL